VPAVLVAISHVLPLKPGLHVHVSGAKKNSNNVTISNIAVKYVLEQEIVASVIVGARLTHR
jgi:hypothetical protein